MKPEHAQEFTNALGQVFEGAVRLADVAVDLNVPDALGLSPAEWAERRLAGPMKLKREERRAVVEANPDKTARELGEALDVNHAQIVRDRQKLRGANAPTDTNNDAEIDEPTGANAPRPEDRRLGFLMTSASDEWATPQHFFDQLDAEFGFELDVCALPASAKCERYFSPEDDGLAQDWTGMCWMNPPYGQEIATWVSKAHQAGLDGATVVCLVPARVDTGWWWDHCRFGEIRFLRGRLAFGDGKMGAPFPSAVVIFGPGYPADVKWWDSKLPVGAQVS